MIGPPDFGLLTWQLLALVLNVWPFYWASACIMCIFSKLHQVWRMDVLTLPVKLVVKAPNQKIADHTVDCDHGWTIGKLKQHLANTYPNNPVSRLYIHYLCYLCTSTSINKCAVVLVTDVWQFLMFPVYFFNLFVVGDVSVWKILHGDGIHYSVLTTSIVFS